MFTDNKQFVLLWNLITDIHLVVVHMLRFITLVLLLCVQCERAFTRRHDTSCGVLWLTV